MLPSREACARHRSHIIGQDRAIEAMRLGLQLESPGYNVFLCGPSGSGRMTTARHVLREFREPRHPLHDFVYTYNFHEPDRARLLVLDPGEGLRLKRAMQKGGLAFASPGTGTTPHLTAENLFHSHWKTDATHVPFKGAGPAVAGLLGGQPPIGCMAGSGPMSNIKSGKLRALAVSSAQRLPQLPEVPTLDELGYPGMQDYTWVGIFVPAGTPPEAPTSPST
jgi:hypothetical protein